MIEVDPEAVLELLDARDFYARARSGLGVVTDGAIAGINDGVTGRIRRPSSEIDPSAAPASILVRSKSTSTSELERMARQERG